jgi:uncharacterized protein (DUF1810 family)
MEAATTRPKEEAVADPYDLDRFVSAQDDGGTYRQALSELQQGAKRSHWMWFVFPQLAGLGNSPTARRYAVSGLDEARAYLRHPVLGPRLRESAGAVAGLTGLSAREIFGSTDEKKLRSSATVFLRADPEEPVFQRLLEQYFEGLPDAATDQLLGGNA